MDDLPADPIARPHEGSSSMTGAKAIVLSLCFLIVLLDGLDTTSIAFVTPMLAHEWGLPPAAFTGAFVGTSVGAVVGYLGCGPLSARWSQRTVALGSIVLFGIGTLLTARSRNVETLILLRLVTAIGLGGCLPVAVAAAADAMTGRYREMAAMLVTTGLSAGSVVGGLAGVPMMLRYGWQSVFIVGGVLPLMMIPAILFVFRRPVGRPAASIGSPIAGLFRDGLAPRTMLLWLFSFLIFVNAYALLFWVPTLLTDFGYSPSQASLGTAAFGMGGLVGNLIMMVCLVRIGVTRMLIGFVILAIAAVVVLAQTSHPSLVLPLLGVLGAGFICGCVGQSALAVALYSDEMRTTGVGWAAAFGRIGSIVGPAIGGLLLSLGWSTREIILTVLPPAFAAIVVLIALEAQRRNLRRGNPDP